MSFPILSRALSFFARCYLCGAAAGTVVAIVALNMDRGTARNVVFGIAIFLFAAGRLAFAIERDQARKREQQKEKGSETHD